MAKKGNTKPKAARRRKPPSKRSNEGAKATKRSATERSPYGEIKKWFLRILNNAGGEIPWKDLLAKFGKKYPGKQTAVLYSYFNSGIATRLNNGNVRLTKKGKRL